MTAQPATGLLCGTFAVMRGARGDHGSVAGLRFARSEFPGTLAAPLETRSGSYIYDAGANSYHDWEFRMNLRQRLYESAIVAKRAKLKTPGIEEALADDVEPDPASSESALGLPSLSEVGPTDEPEAPSPAGSRKSKSITSITSKKAKDEDDIEADILRMRSELVHRILEGLRGDAFMVARDLGLDKLTQENGIRDLMDGCHQESSLSKSL